ncbi:MAG: hypothetical protein ABWY93_22690 [Mycobacterium sp.]
MRLFSLFSRRRTLLERYRTQVRIAWRLRLQRQDLMAEYLVLREAARRLNDDVLAVQTQLVVQRRGHLADLEILAQHTRTIEELKALSGHHGGDDVPGDLLNHVVFGHRSPQ